MDFLAAGFFGAVCARQGDGAKHRPVDLNRIMVRARSKEHLEALKKRLGELLGAEEIRTHGGSDYAYRLYVAMPVWARVMAELATETDYDNFKCEVARHQGKASAAYEHALHDVWLAMHRIQK